MKEFKKWQRSRAVKTVGYINNSDAYDAGEEAGWKAALEWVKKEAISLDERGDANRNVINRELES